MDCNGKFYSMWGQFVTQKARWIGGKLYSEGCVTIITDVKLEPNGETSAMFCVTGKDFDVGVDAEILGIGTANPGDWFGHGINFIAPYGMSFRIEKNEVISTT